MSKITFEGEGAGLGKVLTNGDRNSPFNYVLTCSCEAVLGPLGRFTPNREGIRTALCPKCQHVTAVSGAGQIVMVEPLSKVLEVQKQKEASR